MLGMTMTLERYRRQILVKELGTKGQELLSTKHVVVIGGGGLGSNSASLLVRMGIGRLEIIDNDVVELTNLHRTALFTEDDVGKSKATILEQKLKVSNSDVHVRGINQKVTKENIESLVTRADVIVDGTDSIFLRCLLNEISIKKNIPWVYGGVYETMGMIMGIQPKKTPCFQCISQTIPDSSEEIPVLGSLPAIIAAIQCNETLKILLGKPLAGLIIYDVWSQCFERLTINKNPDCPVCGKQKFTML
jgi:molybdopterin/thiamine biosynthesis adenylyltransferase